MAPLDYREQASLQAENVERRLAFNRSLLDQTRVPQTTRFDKDELLVKEKLGRGGFNYVFAVSGIELHNEFSFLSNYPEIGKDKHQCRARSNIASQSRHQRNKYAVKFLKPADVLGEEKYCQAAIDLMVEAHMLANLSHPNIISLHGMAACGAKGFADGSLGCYFLLIDRLDGTLKDRLPIWRETSVSLATRLQAVVELSDALSYLHSFNIVYRDLKPENIGFDYSGSVKLIDFGLATELDDSKEIAHHAGTYQLSGNTGSRMYMPPEVILGQPYNLSADVFSFAIVLWQVCSLQDKPYSPSHKTTEEYISSVALCHERPSVAVVNEEEQEWPYEIRNMLQAAWDVDIDTRPTMAKIHVNLRSTVSELKGQMPPVVLQERRQSDRRASTGAIKRTSITKVQPKKENTQSSLFARMLIRRRRRSNY